MRGVNDQEITESQTLPDQVFVQSGVAERRVWSRAEFGIESMLRYLVVIARRIRL